MDVPRREGVPFADCRKCSSAIIARDPSAYWISPEVSRMFLCPVCGNKRCPKATDHELECTGSNEPGQPGSDYA